MGPCHSSSKKKGANSKAPENHPPENKQPDPHHNPNQQQQQPNNDQYIPEEPHNHHQPSPLKDNPYTPNSEKFKIQDSPAKVEGVGSSGLKKANDRYGEENLGRSNISSKNEPNHNQDTKMGSHFYYDQRENNSGKVSPDLKKYDYEEVEIKGDYLRTSLHSTQLDRRGIFSEKNKVNLIQSKNVGDYDEPEEEFNIL